MKKEKKKVKKNRIIIYSFITVVMILIVFVVFYYAYNLKQKDNDIEDIKRLMDEVVVNYNEKIEYGTIWTKDELINNLINKEKLSDMNLEIEINNEKVDTEYKFLNVGVLDTKIKLSKIFKYKLIKEYEEKINKEVKRELEVKIEGEVNTSKAGKYEIKVSCLDKNGNEATGKFTVEVKEKPKVSTGSSSKVTSSKSSGSKTTTANKNTVAGRLELAKAEAKRVVKKIIKPGMSDLEKATAITNYIFETVEVQGNQSLEAYKTNYGNEAYAALVMKIAACSGRCKAVTLLCNEAGLKSQHINANKWEHQWNKILINGKWLVFDSQINLVGATKHPLEG